MSLETWKEEFYPTHAREATATPVQALKNSLRKWIGAKPANLAKHEVTLEELDAEELLDGDNCSLCHYSGCPTASVDCSLCPLAPKGCQQNYRIFLYDFNPYPLIEQLTTTLCEALKPSNPPR